MDSTSYRSSLCVGSASSAHSTAACGEQQVFSSRLGGLLGCTAVAAAAACAGASVRLFVVRACVRASNKCSLRR